MFALYPVLLCKLIKAVQRLITYPDCSELYEVGVVMSSQRGAQLSWGNPGGLGNQNGEGMRREWGGGGQFTSNLGPGWTRIAPHKEEGCQVSKRDSGKGELARDQQGELARGMARGIYEGLRHDLVSLICVYVLLYCVNAFNKRIVFRL